MKKHILIIIILILTICLCISIVKDLRGDKTFDILDDLKLGVTYHTIEKKYGENDVCLSSGFLVVGYELDDNKMLVLDFGGGEKGLISASINENKTYKCIENINLNYISENEKIAIIRGGLIVSIMIILYVYLRQG